MFGRWLSSARSASTPEGAEALTEVVRKNLAGADDESVRFVTAIAGLLGAIAYADRDYTENEERREEPLTGDWVNTMVRQLGQVLGRLRKLHFKNLGALLRLQEQLDPELFLPTDVAEIAEEA